MPRTGQINLFALFLSPSFPPSCCHFQLPVFASRLKPSAVLVFPSAALQSHPQHQWHLHSVWGMLPWQIPPIFTNWSVRGLTMQLTNWHPSVLILCLLGADLSTPPRPGEMLKWSHTNCYSSRLHHCSTDTEQPTTMTSSTTFLSLQTQGEHTACQEFMNTM